jgi:diguanylate cyclase (GGDEF)-like protein
VEILLVDDHSLIRSSMALLIKQLGDVVVHEAANCAEARGLLGRIDVDLLVLDYNLPDELGIDFLSWLKTESPEIPVVMLSGEEDPALIQRILGQGASGYILKSSDSEEILGALNLVMEGGMYVPPFLIGSLSSGQPIASQKNEDYEELRHVAEVAQHIIQNKDWSARVSETAGASSDVINVFNQMLEHFEEDMSELQSFAFYDTLTGLSNRRLLEDRLKQALERSRRNGVPMAVMFMDLDKFKSVNDSYGHDQGDLLLIEVSKRIQQSIRGIDTAARLGGDEFVVLLSEVADPADVSIVANRILDGIKQPVELESVTLNPSSSIGICVSGEGDTADSLLKKADQALYRVKQTGRGHFHIYQPGQDYS